MGRKKIEDEHVDTPELRNIRGLRDIRHYKKYISFFPPAKSIALGFLYTYNYNFDVTGDFDKIRHYDWMPVCLCYKIRPEVNTFFGLNFHHLPVKARTVWLARAKRLWGKKFPTRGKNVNTPMKVNVSYTRILSILYGAKLGVRQYRFDRVNDIRIVPNSQWYTLFRYHANTYLKSSYEKKVKLYNAGRLY